MEETNWLEETNWQEETIPLEKAIPVPKETIPSQEESIPWKFGARVRTIQPVSLMFGRIKRGATGIFLDVTHGYAYDYAKVALEEPYNKIEWFKFEEIEEIPDKECNLQDGQKA